jgi:pimeloyl-ACP methyl ester carboxylesterase
MYRPALVVPLLIVLAQPAAAPASTGPSSGLVPLRTGVTLHYAVQGDPAGQPIVLVHGVGDSWRSWELVLPHLPSRYRVYAVSMRGHGLSDAPQTGYSQQEMAGDVTAFLEAMELRGVTLVGHSLGSFIAQAVAVADRGRLAGLVLVGSGPGGAPGPDVYGEVKRVFEGLAADPRGARDFQASTVRRPVPAAFFETMVETLAGVQPHVWRQVIAAVYDADTAAALGRITVPTLLVRGEHDAMLSAADQQALLAKIRGARLIEYPGTGHAPQWEWPDRFAADLVAFVTALATPAAPTR